MKEIDFTRIKVFGSFEDEAAGKTEEVNVAKLLANRMKYSGPVLLDIGFEEVASAIYHADGPVEIPEESVGPIRECVLSAPYFAAVKRAILKTLE